MSDPYEKENPFISTVVEQCTGASEKDSKSSNVEATNKIVAGVASSENEKGNP